jgi:tetratricopeptide (TPR) repeat protein
MNLTFSQPLAAIMTNDAGGTASQQTLDTGIAKLERWQSSNVHPCWYAAHWSYFAEACLRLDAPKRALACVERGFEVLTICGTDFWRPELLRLQAAANAALGEPDTAEALYREALTVARSMGAAYFVLRTALGLAELVEGMAAEYPARGQLRDALAPFAQQPETAATRRARAVLQ